MTEPFFFHCSIIFCEAPELSPRLVSLPEASIPNMKQMVCFAWSLHKCRHSMYDVHRLTGREKRLNSGPTVPYSVIFQLPYRSSWGNLLFLFWEFLWICSWVTAAFQCVFWAVAWLHLSIPFFLIENTYFLFSKNSF